MRKSSGLVALVFGVVLVPTAALAAPVEAVPVEFSILQNVSGLATLDTAGLGGTAPAGTCWWVWIPVPCDDE